MNLLSFKTFLLLEAKKEKSSPIVSKITIKGKSDDNSSIEYKDDPTDDEANKTLKRTIHTKQVFRTGNQLLKAPINGPLRLDKNKNPTKGITNNDKKNGTVTLNFISERIKKPIYIHHHFINDSYNNKGKGRNAQQDELMYDKKGKSYDLAYQGKNDHVAGWQHLINNKIMSDAFDQICKFTFNCSTYEEASKLCNEVINNHYPYGPRYFIKVEDMYEKEQYKYQSFIYTFTFLEKDSKYIQDLGAKLIAEWGNKSEEYDNFNFFFKSLYPMFWTFFNPKPYKDSNEAKGKVGFWDHHNDDNIDKGIIMFKKESVERQEQRFLTEGTSIDAQGNVQSLSEEQQHWLKENLEEIKKANDDTVPVRSLFLNFSDYRNIDETHYFVGGKIHERDKGLIESDDDNDDPPRKEHYYYLPEAKRWIAQEKKAGRCWYDTMKKGLLIDCYLCDYVSNKYAGHAAVLRGLVEERKKKKAGGKKYLDQFDC